MRATATTISSALGLKLPLPQGAEKIRYIGGEKGSGTVVAGALRAVPATGSRPFLPPGPIAGLHQQTAEAYQLWNSDGHSVRGVHRPPVSRACST